MAFKKPRKLVSQPTRLVVGLFQDRRTRLAARVAGNLGGRTVVVDRGDDQLVAVETGPDPRIGQLVRDRVTDRLDGDRGFPGHPEVVLTVAVGGRFGSGCNR